MKLLKLYNISNKKNGTGILEDVFNTEFVVSITTVQSKSGHEEYRIVLSNGDIHHYPTESYKYDLY